ncbi:phage portal protein [Carnobacterium divergens]|uniref:phage portal protein n=1 Tax=Carnobacterium divergens TaxID=2748 RepID=UPI00288DD40F|nr:phage portal protein [Carnobacterium divergens]MDT2011126.1 phage portal protein [Carnobacterium divergens]
MGFFDLFSKNKDSVAEEKEIQSANTNFNKQILDTFFCETQANIAFKNYAIQICINKIANAITRCEFETLEKGKYVEKDNWYLLNIEPNKNQNSGKFWNKVIEQMVNNPDGALVIQSDSGEFLIADSYSVQKYAIYENIYSNVSVEGYIFRKTFTESDVFNFKLNNSKVRKFINGIYSDYGKLIGGAIKNYNRSNALKFIAELDTTTEQWKSEEVTDEDGNPTGETKFDNVMDDLFDNRFATFLSDRDAIMPLELGIKLNDMNSGGSKSSGSAANRTTRDIAAIFDDVLNLCADAFNIPRGLLKGDVADVEKMTDNFLAFCINPLTEEIEDEINRKWYGKENVLQRTKLKVRTDRIKNYDISKLATPAELMSRIGVYSVNNILRLLGEEPIQEAWADMHVISKNYELMEENLEGGDIDEKVKD